VRSESDLDVSLALTTLPVQLRVNRTRVLASLPLDQAPRSDNPGLSLALWIAWCGLLFAVVAIGWVLHRVMQLSERRAAFASAVTHELRTPLTTFRMYSEMLAEEMVPPEKQREHAETMKTQADRLSRLVENVLQFARLESGSSVPVLETITVVDLFDRLFPCWQQRADEADMNLVWLVEPADSEKTLTVPVVAIDQILFNLIDNACKYGVPSRSNRIEIAVQQEARFWRFSVRDDGPGVSPHFQARLFEPFCKSDQDAAETAPGVGLGLAHCHRMARSFSGRVVHGPQTTGTVFTLELPR